jgi:hypothetical protein
MNPYGLSLPATSESDSLRRQDPVQRQQNTAEIRRLAQRRLDELKRRKSCLVEAFVYQAAIDENTYPEERHNLDQQVALAELEHLEAHEDEIEVEGALNFSAYVLSNAGRLWVESDLSGKQRLQQALFPRGLTFDNSSIATPVTSSIFYAIEDVWAPREEFGCPPGIRTPIACSRGRCPSR